MDEPSPARAYVRFGAMITVEIDEMTWLIDDIAEHGEATDPADARRREVPDFSSQPAGRTC